MAKWSVFLTSLFAVLLLFFMLSCEGIEGPGSLIDSDGDGWSNTQEKTAGTDPDNTDTDGDGYWDPLDPNPLDPNIPVDKGLPRPSDTEPSTPEDSGTTITPADDTATLAINPEAAALKEFHKVQAAVEIMIKNNKLTNIPHPVRVPTNDMHRFPDITTRHGSVGVGYLLFCYDFDGDGDPDTNYIRGRWTKGTYICDRNGNVTQVTTGY